MTGAASGGHGRAPRNTGQQQIRERVEDLLRRMSLDRKIGQMTLAERAFVTPDDVRVHHLGAVLSGAGSSPGANRPSDWVDMIDALWAASMGDGGPAIPILYGVDAVHGHNNVRGATIFPHNIGLGAASDLDLIGRVARVTAREVLATGVDWTFAPTLAVAGDPRWGRTYESYSEDPDVVTAHAGRMVAGLQRNGDEPGVLACAKHWVGDGGTTRGEDQGDTCMSECDLRRIHAAPYYAALEAGVMTIMVSYNGWNGERCHGHRYLLTELLKQEMGFAGLLVSDWDAVEQLDADYGRAVARAANAGIDLFMVPERWRQFIDELRTQVESGAVPMARIDDAVRRILSVKFAAGLFEASRPASRPMADHGSFGSAEHRAVAREAVRKSLVLLKNEGGLLPLDRSARILVAGKNAHDVGHQCGGFTVTWQGTSGNGAVEGGTSIWEGIRAVAPGATLSVDGSGGGTDVDVAIVVIGERPYAEGLGDLRPPPGEATDGASPRPGPRPHEPYGATLELATLHPEDLRTLGRIAARGIPIVAVLVSGRPLIVNRELAASTAFVAAWLPGSEGRGIADVLFGDHDFQGRLAFSWPSGEAGTRSPAEPPSGIIFARGYGLSLR